MLLAEAGQKFRQAAKQGHLGLLKGLYLLHPDVLNSSGPQTGKNALDWAIEANQKKAVAWLQKQGASPSNPSTLAELISNFDSLTLANEPEEVDPIVLEDHAGFKTAILHAIDLFKAKCAAEVTFLPKLSLAEKKGYWERVVLYVNQLDFNSSDSVEKLNMMESLGFNLFHIEDQFVSDLVTLRNAPEVFSGRLKEARIDLYYLSAVLAGEILRLREVYPHCLIRRLAGKSETIQAHLFYLKPELLAVHSNRFSTLFTQIAIQEAYFKYKLVKAFIAPQEAVSHVERLNHHWKETGDFHAEVIAFNAYEAGVDSNRRLFALLIERAQCIKSQTLPRTQFITYMNSNNHTTMIDVSWNGVEKCLEVICLDSVGVDMVSYQRMANDLQYCLRQAGLPSKLVVCSTDLQKDAYSCTLYSLQLAKISAQQSFETWNALAVYRPELNRTPSIKWLPVTALGLQAVKLAQSTSYQGEFLDQLTRNEKLKQSAYPAKYDAEKKLERTRQKTAGNYLGGLSAEEVESKTQKIQSLVRAKTPDVAVRRLAAGEGKISQLAFMLQAYPDTINKPGPESHKTPLQFAYEKNKHDRAALLVKEGAIPHPSPPPLAGEGIRGALKN